ncbi:MAG: hypothetical protein CVU34_00200 [Betaproteobacteria bacterium HGW-Betaproteobacteria-7]|jgi:hypothetical protein|nr:MAG: hypothetical protein CVU34_00200 [Betaproteobacteria bacterium HGW-Betaproteobacteria-7]
MKKEDARQHIQQHLEPGDFLVGFFQAIQPFKWWLFLFIGPLAVLSMKYYFVAVTRKGITFHRINLMGKFAGQDTFVFSDIKSVKIGKGMLQRPMTFRFNNGRKLHLKGQLKGVEKVAKIDAETQRFIEDNVRTEK